MLLYPSVMTRLPVAWERGLFLLSRCWLHFKSEVGWLWMTIRCNTKHFWMLALLGTFSIHLSMPPSLDVESRGPSRSTWAFWGHVQHPIFLRNRMTCPVATAARWWCSVAGEQEQVASSSGGGSSGSISTSSPGLHARVQRWEWRGRRWRSNWL